MNLLSAGFSGFALGGSLIVDPNGEIVAEAEY